MSTPTLQRLLRLALAREAPTWNRGLHLDEAGGLPRQPSTWWFLAGVIDLDRPLALFKAGREPLWRDGSIQHPQPMSISAAVTEIQSARLSAGQLRYRQFRAQQHALDELIDQVESAVREGARDVPGALRDRVELTLAMVHGQVPPWLGRETEPARLLDELFIAEGRLRQQYYVGVRLELEDSA